MQIGMSLTTSYAIDRDPKALFDGLTEQVKAMAELGFASLSLGDHHVTQNHYFQVLPAMSHLSAFTGDMRLIPLFLLPFYNPILLAEQLAMLDVISGGRTTAICGLGHQPEAHVAFETPQRLRVSRFVETFEIMRLLWNQDDVSYSGRHYNISGVSINPKPLSQPLPMWIGANADPAVQRAAQIADAWVISPGWTPDYIEERLRFYRAELEACGRSEQVNELVVRRDLHLAPTQEEALRDAEVLLTRAVVEGVCFAMRDSLELMRGQGVSPSEVRAIGGGARSRMWLQTLANVFGLPLATVQPAGGAAFGAALLAAVGCGMFSSIQDAAQSCIKTGSAVEPEASLTAVYDELYDAYRQLYPALKNSFATLADINARQRQ